MQFYKIFFYSVVLFTILLKGKKSFISCQREGED